MKIAPEYPGLVAYANDAMNGLDLANQIMDFERRESLKHVLAEQSKKMLESAPKVVDAPADATPRTSSVRRDVEIPKPPDLKTHVIRNYDLGEIFDYINPKTLYSKHLGFQNYVEAFEAGDPKARDLHDRVEEVAQQMLARSDISANAVYRFFPAQSDGDRTIMIYSPDGKTVLESFTFGRQSDAPYLCLADYVAARDSGRTDYLCMFVTTIGTGVRALAEDWKNKGDYLRSHILQVLALEGAEAFAELLHVKIRQMWGIGDPPGLSLKDLVQAHYHGKRFSFGYPACPQTRRSGAAIPPARSREECDRRAAHRRLHDGSRKRRQRHRLPSSRGEVLQPLAGRHRAPRARVRSPRRQARRQLALLLRLAA